eukprot:834004-Pelagomonas_calceolata.AAC.1
MQDFTVGLRHRLHGVWRDVEGVDPRETNNKLATYQALFALPLTTMCTSQSGYRGICIWICHNKSCKMSADLG